VPRFAPPPRWPDNRLDGDRQQSISHFIAERNAESSASYQAALATNIGLVASLFESTNDLLTFGTGQALAERPSLLAVARYLAGPPVSADDFDTLAGATIAKRRRLDDTLAQRAAALLETAIDRTRFPWLFSQPSRPPTPTEREVALKWTAGLKTLQEVQTTRRATSSARQEAAVAALLERQGYRKQTPGPVTFVDDVERGSYARETLVAGVKCDLPVRLYDGRLLLIECKVSNSALNSVKRLNRECGGKAGHWRDKFGQSAVSAVVLAGVFRLANLKAAQEEHQLALFWEHDLTPLERFLIEAR
jgi:hypothetical protein